MEWLHAFYLLLMRFHDILQTCAVNDHVNPCSSFVDFVKHLLNNPAEREHFFTVRKKMCGKF